DERDLLEICKQVESRAVERAGADKAGPIAEAERVAVGRRLSGTPDADGRPGTSHVLDDDGLAERGPHALADNAPERVGRAARRERHDHRDWTRWIILRPRPNCACEIGASERRRDCDGTGYRLHRFPPGLLRRR